jgi:signal transduction histidine kinase
MTSGKTMPSGSDRVDGKGNRRVQNNPAAFIKELSQYAEEEGLYWFRTTSLKLMNPENKPDEPPCLDCHTRQGYNTGDIRGALSIAIPMDFSYSILRTERSGMILAGIITILSLMFILYIMMRKLVISPLKQISLSIKDFSDRGEDVSPVRTGDELEDLSMSFATMSSSLKAYHSHLEDMVHAATKDLENANERLVELNRMKSDFVAKVSHELRTPLTSIQGAMDYLSARFSAKIDTDHDMNEIMSFITVIRKNAGRLVRMVNDTLDLERIESGALDMHFSQIAILNLIKEVITTFQSITNEKKITFRVIASPETVVLADEDRIRQVMINLISNSITASPRESEIEITVSESDRELRTSVADQGRGIPAEEHDRVFDKFYTRGSKDGSGLGLAICKGIIDAHKGKIWIEERTDSSGCAFIFSLPIPGKDM